MEYSGYTIQAYKPSPSLYEIKFDGSGKVADCLSGLFTSTGLAKQQIDAYLSGRLTKRKPDVKTTNQS